MKTQLEIGSGTGQNLKWISKIDATNIAIDISIKNLILSTLQNKNVIHVGASAECLPFANDSIEKIYLLDVLEHVDNIEKVCMEVNRVLKTGGELEICTPNPLSEKWILLFYKKYWDDVNHVRFLDVDGIKTIFGDSFKENKRYQEEGIQNFTLFLLWAIGCRIDSQVGGWVTNNYYMKPLARLISGAGILFSERIIRSKYWWLPITPLCFLIGKIFSLIFPKTFRILLTKI